MLQAGDDLQQDMLTIQIIRIMDQLWLREGLDLKIVTFACMPTGDKRGTIKQLSDYFILLQVLLDSVCL